MVADAVIYHPTVAHYLRYMATTLGRDKLMRVFQYFARFYAWYLLRANATADKVAPWNALKKQFGLFRKVFRAGKFVEHLKAAATASDAKSMDPVLKYTQVGRQLGYAGYLACDSLTIPHAAGIKTWKHATRMQHEAYRSWAVGIAFSILGQLYTLRQLSVRASKVDLKEGEGVVESKTITIERAAAKKQLLCDVCDILVPLSGLGYNRFLDDGVVGLTGTLSSLIGVYTQWKKTA
ncbi:peroxisomal biogenesis factor 11 [Fusarium langsethiae]|jgi:peroxin-11B|uniref:Peroxisomal biogenesis factor 11 n=2 Tax=Fusarium sambucinum species complex TaxID=569360 RepID=A0A0M9F2M7_FUSLA|nr:peroxisomal biogenesis factor 11 [Fusarium langsethiae]RGP71415.1 peroxisomal biogenesis factor 11 [Fusarium sporotrichioides]GKU06361.1 unnamed protein product [Fusarium langsethiae]GKU17252.1 unnamed protein product [Fusarium langsethiae]